MQVKVNGTISQFLKGLPNVKPETIIGLPVRNTAGNSVGIITDIDEKADLWTGIIEIDDTPYSVKTERKIRNDKN